jgi:putative ABC transport system permease protein
MHPLDRKLLRDLWRMRLHVVATILVLACGLAIFVMAVGMRESLDRTRDAYYADKRMADMAVSLVRAPNRLATRLASVPGVARLETRIAGLALLDVTQIEEPASARLVSLPESGRPAVNDLVLRAGRWPDPRQPEEALMSEAFAIALGLRLGETVPATLHGRTETLRIVGFANSPEFVFVAAPGELFPQPERFGVLWMERKALARALDLEGAFNEAVFRLAPGAVPARTARAIDEVLRPYGASGAYGRDRMLSDRYLKEELHQLATMATFLPVFFLTVSAFLVNVALGRVVATERSNIGLLKAFGYSNAAVAWHYAKSALLIALFAVLAGSALGVWFGHSIVKVYQQYYHFPRLEFSASGLTHVFAALAGFVAAAAGAWTSVRGAAQLAPAAALQPPEPPSFRRASGKGAQVVAALDAKSRVIARRILRYPVRSLTTVLGVAFAMSLLIVARSFPAVMSYLLDVQFGMGNRQNVTLSFPEARPIATLHSVARLPGVRYVEPFRTDDVILHHGQRHVQEALVGVWPNARLSRVVSEDGGVLSAPAGGVVLARTLARKLNVEPGDTIEIEQVRGKRLRTRVPVVGLASPMMGGSAYMELLSLARLMREPDRISGAHVLYDPLQHSAFNARVKATPALASASFVTLAERATRKNFDEHVGLMISIYSIFAGVMAGGVAFSAARVTLAEQARDLATLRVLGFTRAEASYVLVGEIMALAVLAVPVGCLLGTALAMWLLQFFRTELYAFPYVFDRSSYAFAIAFTLACVLAASLLVRREVDRLDMVAVLKARD